MQSKNGKTGFSPSIVIGKSNSAQYIVGAFEECAIDNALCSSQFIVSRGGAVAITTSQNRKEVRNVRLDRSTNLVTAPHTAAKFDSDSHDPLTVDLKNMIEAIDQTILQVDRCLNQTEIGDTRQRLEFGRRRMLRLSQWIRSVIDSSLIRRGKVQSCYRWANISQWLSKERCRWTTLAHQAHLVLSCEFHVDPLSKIWTDTEIVQRILENLVANAVEVSEPDQNIRIVAELSKDDEPWLIISVIDSSPAAIPDASATEFKSDFFDIPNATSPLQGHGLGLSVCMQLARLIGGYLDFSSLPGRGTRFDLHLPAGGVYAWLRRHSRQGPTKSSADVTYIIDVDSESMTVGNSSRKMLMVDHTIQHIVFNRASILRFDNSRWLLLPWVEFLNSDTLISDFALEISRLLPELPKERIQSAISIISIGSLSRLVGCIEQVISKIKNSKMTEKKVVTPLHFDPGLRAEKELVASRTPVARMHRRIDGKHQAIRPPRLTFRMLNTDSQSLNF